MIKISIIIPIYNIDKYLKRCLDSIIAQTYENLEIILIDDGSTDCSSDICDEYGGADNRIIVVHKKNEGVVKARNTGLEIATGDFIGFVDGDDYIALDMYQYLVYLYNFTKADIICCGVSRRYPKSNKAFDTKQFKGVRVYKKDEALYRFQLNDDIGVAAWNKIFRKDVILGLEFEKYRRMDDARFVCRAIQNAETIAYGSEAKYIYEIHGNSITQSGFNDNAYDILKVTDTNYDNIKALGFETYNYSMGRIAWYIVFLNEMIKGDAYDQSVVMKLRTMINNNWISIKTNDELGLIRKLQFFLAGNYFSLYSIAYKTYCKVSGK